jgi:hypothetical protein
VAASTVPPSEAPTIVIHPSDPRHGKLAHRHRNFHPASETAMGGGAANREARDAAAADADATAPPATSRASALQVIVLVSWFCFFFPSLFPPSFLFASYFSGFFSGHFFYLFFCFYFGFFTESESTIPTLNSKSPE